MSVYQIMDERKTCNPDDTQCSCAAIGYDSGAVLTLHRKPPCFCKPYDSGEHLISGRRRVAQECPGGKIYLIATCMRCDQEFALP